MSGVDNLIVEARTALLDAVEALTAHKDAVVLIGAQAIYLRTGNATFALAEATKDSDLAIDARTLGEDPRLEEAMTAAGFILNPVSKQPGAWMSPTGIPVDLMVPEYLAGSGSRRGAYSSAQQALCATGGRDRSGHRRQGSDDRRCA